MFCLILLFAMAVVSESTVMAPMNLTLCNETSENVNRLMVDVYLVQPQQHNYCGHINTSTPVVSSHMTYRFDAHILDTFVNFGLVAPC